MSKYKAVTGETPQLSSDEKTSQEHSYSSAQRQTSTPSTQKQSAITTQDGSRDKQKEALYQYAMIVTPALRELWKAGLLKTYEVRDADGVVITVRLEFSMKYWTRALELK